MWKTCGKPYRLCGKLCGKLWIVKKPRRYKAFMNIGKQKMLLKEKRMTRNMEKKPR